MKQILPILLFLFFLNPLYPIYAQDLPAGRQDATGSSARREKILDRIEAKRTAAFGRLEERRERIASKAAELKTRLQKFRDQKKAERAERINSNLNTINERRTDHMLKRLKRMAEILVKLEQRVSEATSAGKDTSSVSTSINQAKTAVTVAQTAVEAQATKDYTIEATSEATIRADAQAARDSLHQDLKAAHDLVVAARKAVTNAIKTAASTLGGIKYGQ